MTNITNNVRFVANGIVATKEQCDIQLSQHKITLIEANAGAAKTTTLCLRIGEALSRGLPPEKILALVFTPEARDVMKSRLQQVGLPYSTVAKIRINTIDDFSSEILFKIEKIEVSRLRFTKDLRSHVINAIENVSQKYTEKFDFLDIRTHSIAISQFLEYQSQLKATMAFDEELPIYELEERAAYLNVPLTDYLTTLEYERIRLGNFDEVLFRATFDATYDLATTLGKFPEANEFLPEYKLIVVDELHDLNEPAYRILESLIDKPDIYFVGAGDKDQVIYSKLGADEQYLKYRFSNRYSNNKRYPLTVTYRHGPHLAYAMGEFKEKDIQSELPLKTEIIQLHYHAETQENCEEQVIKSLKKWLSDGFRLDQCAILLRERHQSVAIENALMRANIGYRTLGMQGYLQREEILFLRGLIAIALKNLVTVQSEFVRKGIVEALAIFGEIDITVKGLDYAKNVIHKDPTILNSFFSGKIQQNETEKINGRITSVVEYLENISPDNLAGQVLRDVYEKIDMKSAAKRIYVHSHDAGVVSKSVEGFIEIAKQSKMNLREFSEWIGAADAYTATKKNKNLVLVECVANAKGKEFDHVIMPFLENGEFPNLVKNLKEEKNLFYVAATRTISRLTLISPSDQEKRSIFISQMNMPSIQTRANSAVLINQSKIITEPSRIDLRVPFEDKDIVKSLGAKWDATRKIWYLNSGVDSTQFGPWLP
jgi:DNA helicase-2/ATP-dependent DNA helicase PcrA